MAEFGLILDHPASKDILSKLLSGSTSKEVAQWLKVKYPNKNQSHLRLSQKLLDEFKNSQFTDYIPQFEQDLVEISSKKDNPDAKYMSAALTNIKPYRERMTELADLKLHTMITLEKNIGILLTRFEQMYDLMQHSPTDAKFDNTFIRYFNAVKDGLETIEKMKNNSSDNLVQHNLTMKMLQDYINIIQDVVRRNMAKFDPEIASQFMDELYSELDSIQLPDGLSPEEERIESQRYEAQVVEIVNSNDS